MRVRRRCTTKLGTRSCCNACGSQPARPLPQRGPVAELRAHDQAHGTQYAATLRAWLEAQGDLAEAGRALGVHENTVRYRLRKMIELTQLDLADARKRLAMMIELAAAEELS